MSSWRVFGLSLNKNAHDLLLSAFEFGIRSAECGSKSEPRTEQRTQQKREYANKRLSKVMEKCRGGSRTAPTDAAAQMPLLPRRVAEKV